MSVCRMNVCLSVYHFSVLLLPLILSDGQNHLPVLTVAAFQVTQSALRYLSKILFLISNSLPAIDHRIFYVCCTNFRNIPLH